MSCAPTAIVRSATTRGTTCHPDLASSADHFIDISTMVVHLHLGADVRVSRHGPLDRARRTRPSHSPVTPASTHRCTLSAPELSPLLHHHAPTIQVPAVAAVALQTPAMAARHRSGDTLQCPLRGLATGAQEPSGVGQAHARLAAQ